MLADEPVTLPILAIYLVGVLIGIAVIRDRWAARLGLALVWPLGPIAFLVVLAILLVTAAILWPAPVLAALAILGAAAWLML
jgi:hypothetical protein